MVISVLLEHSKEKNVVRNPIWAGLRGIWIHAHIKHQWPTSVRYAKGD